MKRIGTLLVLCGMMAGVQAQEAQFTLPFDFPPVFSGNFGEIRSNHFHGGLDFKTGGATGKKVRALADGHISRIRVTHGSGYVLDVAYDNGYSTINRHLEAFVGDMAERVEALQYEQESWEVEIVPEKGEYPVKAGEVIALSGNTGYSFGPHLHLDMFETSTGDYIDPLPFFASRVKDHTAPRALGIMLFPQTGKGVVMGKTDNQRFPLQPKQPITAWGVIGAGIRAYDHMDGAHNRYGVKTVVLEVDGEEVFRSVVDRFAQSESRAINSWTDGQYMKSFIEPGCRLRLLHPANGRRGLVEINEERPYRFVYTLSDALGNTSKVSFTVQGKRQEIPAPAHNGKYLLRWDRTNYLQEPGMQLFIPKGMLYDDVRLNTYVCADSADIALTYRLHDTRIPLHSYCDLRIGVRHLPIADTTKYYVASIDAKGKKQSLGGHYEAGYMKVRVRELGTFTVAIDTVPPTILPVNRAGWGRNGRIVLKPKDAETDIASYRGTIDGKYALFGKPNSVQGLLVCRLDPKRIERGGRHTLQISVTDECGNTTTEEYEFVW